MFVPEVGPCPNDVAGCRQGGELAAARHVVVVEVRLDDVRDPDVQLASRGEIHVDIAAWVDDRGDAGDVVRNEGRQMPEPFDPELAKLHAGEPSTARQARSRGSSRDPSRPSPDARLGRGRRGAREARGQAPIDGEELV
jgi:hypothetical protein